MATVFPIYVINLKRNPERRLYMQRQLDTLSLKYEFVDAVDKYELKSKAYRMRLAKSLDIDESLLENKYATVVGHTETEQNKNRQSNNSGSLATSLSHIKIYSLMVKDGIGRACILEDDTELLPTFPEVLTTVPKLEWDILMLGSQPKTDFMRIITEEKPIKRMRTFYDKHLLFLNRIRFVFKSLLFLSNRRVDYSSNSKQRAYHLKHLLKEYGIDPHLHPKQSESFAKVLEEHDTKYQEIIKTTMPTNTSLSSGERKWYKKKCKDLHLRLKIHTDIRFGALPEKASLAPITEYHRIADPKSSFASAIAYLVNQSTAMRWKREVLARNLDIDRVPWQLYKNEQVKVRIVTPPCTYPAYNYLVYSPRRL